MTQRGGLFPTGLRKNMSSGVPLNRDALEQRDYVLLITAVLDTQPEKSLPNVNARVFFLSSCTNKPQQPVGRSDMCRAQQRI